MRGAELDILLVVFFSLAVLWLIAQEFTSAGPPVPKGVSILSAAVIASIVGGDWVFGRQQILGNPEGVVHTLLKLVLGLFVVIAVSGGLAALWSSRSPIAAIVNVLWSGGLLLLALRFMGVW